MNILESSNAHFSPKPLGAGDLIDRSFRFYRKFFWTFIFIASPPIVISTILLVGWTALGRNIFEVTSSNPSEAIFYRLFSLLGVFIIWLIQIIATAVVMGGASRNFVRHILFNEKITFQETYKNVKSRFFGLVGISTLIIFIISVASYIIFGIVYLLAVLIILFTIFALKAFPTLATIISIIFVIAVIFGMAFLFFFVVSRFVYVPQIMLVEGKGAFSAMGRSISLAKKNVKRVAALFIFTFVATYSALSLFYVLLGWAASANGINLSDMFFADTVPAWYEISTQVIGQITLILLMPVWMIGLCLLYVDERVRNEGYDIELLASKYLGEMPSVPAKFANPLEPALAKQTSPTKTKEQLNKKDSSNSTLGLG